MAGWLPTVILAGVVVSTAPAGTAVARTAEARHDFHVSYTRMAIESTVISAQIRLFSDDVTRALVERSRTPSLTLNSKQGEAAFQAYVAEQFPVHRRRPPPGAGRRQQRAGRRDVVVRVDLDVAHSDHGGLDCTTRRCSSCSAISRTS